MFLAEPSPTPWDLHFELLGIPVRISPWFWLANVFFGWEFATSLARMSGGTVNIGAALLMWTAVVLVSITVHEFGHAFAFRYYGIRAHVVLYHFGGLAVPDNTSDFGRHLRGGTLQNIVVAAAGPAASLALGLVFVAIVYNGGYYVPSPLPTIHQLDFLWHGERIPSVLLQGLLNAILFVNIVWALVNLLPVYPLDGGQISRELFTLGNPRSGIRNSLLLSIAVGGLIAIWAFLGGDTYLGFMFSMLAYSSYAILQAYSGRGGFGRG